MYRFHIYPGNHSNIIKEGLLRRENWMEEEKEPLAFVGTQFIWKPSNLSIAGYIKLDSINRSRQKNYVQVFNHFENILGICTKTGLVRSLKKYYKHNREAKRADYTVFDSIPTSFVITAGVENKEYNRFINRFKDLEKQSAENERTPIKHCQGNFWLVKPANLNQGKGIKLFKSLREIHNFLKDKKLHSYWVVQKYLERPLLYNGRKFDLRIWVSVSGKNEVHVYRKAYIRTSSDRFDLSSKDDYIHLTNNCLQQFGDNYGKHEDGNTLPMEILDEYFEQLFPGKNVRVDTHIWPRIKDLIIDSFLCTKAQLNPSNRQNVFELFGFDFMIDEDLRTWLIEINTNPYLGTPNEYIENLLPKMVDDLLELNVDHLFPPKNSNRNGRANDFELIYCEAGSRHNNGPLNIRSSYMQSVYPVPEITPPEVAKKNYLQQKYAQDTKSPLKNSNTMGASNPELKGTYDPLNLQEFDYLRLTATDGGFAETMSEAKNVEDPSAHISNNSASYKGLFKHKTKNYKVKKSTLQQITKNLHLASIYNSDLDNFALSSELEVVLSSLRNWELISSRKRKIATEALKLIAQSPKSGLIVLPNTIKGLARLLKSSNVPVDIKLSVIESLNCVTRDFDHKREIICSRLMHELVKICVDSCDTASLFSYGSELPVATLKCLVNLGAMFFRKPPKIVDAREFDQIKSSYLAQGGLITLWIVANQSQEPEMRDIAQNSFLGTVDSKTLLRQLHLLEVLKIIPEEDTENEDSENEEEKKSDFGARRSSKASNNVLDPHQNPKRSVESSAILYDAKFHADIDLHHLDKTNTMKSSYHTMDMKNSSVGFPKSLLKFYTVDELVNEFSTFVRDLQYVELDKENEERSLKTIPEKPNKSERRANSQLEEIKKPSSVPKPLKKKRQKVGKMDLLQVYHASHRDQAQAPLMNDYTLKTKSVKNSVVEYSGRSKRGLSLDAHKKSFESISESDIDLKNSKANVVSSRKHRDIEQFVKSKGKTMDAKSMALQVKEKMGANLLAAQKPPLYNNNQKNLANSWAIYNSENNAPSLSQKGSNNQNKLPVIAKNKNLKLKPLEQISKFDKDVKPQAYFDLNEHEILDHYQKPLESSRSMDQRVLSNLSPILFEKNLEPENAV